MIKLFICVSKDKIVQFYLLECIWLIKCTWPLLPDSLISTFIIACVCVSKYAIKSCYNWTTVQVYNINGTRFLDTPVLIWWYKLGVDQVFWLGHINSNLPRNIMLYLNNNNIYEYGMLLNSVIFYIKILTSEECHMGPIHRNAATFFHL